MPQGTRKTIPEEDWTGQPVLFDHLRAFGCTAYVHIPKEKRKKLDQTSWKGILLGYNKRIYLIWNPATKVLVPSISVQFDENAVSKAARTAVRKPLAAPIDEGTASGGVTGKVESDDEEDVINLFDKVSRIPDR